MSDPKCIVQVGIHPGPYWRDRSGSLIVCSRHRAQYEERPDEFGPFDWQPVSEADPMSDTPAPTAQ